MAHGGNNRILTQNRKCALSGIPLAFTRQLTTGHMQNASLDRIDSKLPYIETNVQWVHKHINKIKQDLDLQYFIELCTAVAKNNEKVT